MVMLIIYALSVLSVRCVRRAVSVGTTTQRQCVLFLAPRLVLSCGGGGGGGGGSYGCGCDCGCSSLGTTRTTLCPSHHGDAGRYHSSRRACGSYGVTIVSVGTDGRLDSLLLLPLSPFIHPATHRTPDAVFF